MFILLSSIGPLGQKKIMLALCSFMWLGDCGVVCSSILATERNGSWRNGSFDESDLLIERCNACLSDVVVRHEVIPATRRATLTS